MNVLKSLACALALFSRIPVPQFEWRDENMRYMMAFFPVVGVAVGLLLALWCWLCGAVGFGAAVRAAGVVALPVVLTGGIHLDGFADVADAQASHAPLERKRQILKDPHVGAFAIIWTCAWFVLEFVFAVELDPALVGALAAVPVLSRALSGLATVRFPKASQDGMLAQERDSARTGAVTAALVAWAVAAVACMVGAGGVPGAVAAAVGLACLALLHPFARTQFGGMSGDVAGAFLQVAELAMLVALVCAQQAL